MEIKFLFEDKKNQISNEFKFEKFVEFSFVSEDKKDFPNLSRILLQSFDVIKIIFFVFIYF
jgi:hypothetical protein